MASPPSRSEAASALNDAEVTVAKVSRLVRYPQKVYLVAGSMMGLLMVSTTIPNDGVRLVAPLLFFIVGGITFWGPLVESGIRPLPALVRNRSYTLVAGFLAVLFPLVATSTRLTLGGWRTLPLALGFLSIPAVLLLGRWRNGILCRQIMAGVQ
jgi:hypothetical protein